MGHTALRLESFKELVTSNSKSNGGAFTVKSKKTGKDFTYKIARKEFKGKFYTHCYIETQYMQFKYIGTFKDGNIIKNKMINADQTAQGLSWLINNALGENWEKIQAQSHLMHLGKCVKCGRPLTDSDSIEMGLGPYCRSVI